MNNNQYNLIIDLDANKLSYEIRVWDCYYGSKKDPVFLYNGSITTCKKSDSVAKKELQLLTDAKEAYKESLKPKEIILLEI